MSSEISKSKNMSSNLKIQAFVSQNFPEENRNTSQLNLYNDTTQFLEKVEKEIGEVVNMDEIRSCLEAFDGFIHEQKLPSLDNSVHQQLVQIWIDRLTLFKKQV